MSEEKFIFIGANPPEGQIANPGGQLTASIGLKNYAENEGYNFCVIDTTQSSFPLPPFKERLIRGLIRLVDMFRLLRVGNIKGVIIFSSAGFSFYERSLMAGLSRAFGVKSVFFMRDGHFANSIKKSYLTRMFAKLALMLPNIIGVQGENWRVVFRDLGVRDERIVTIRNWLPTNFQVKQNSIKIATGERLRFCFVGWLVPEKGVLELFDAIRILAEKYSFKVIFVGGGGCEDFLREQTNKCGLEEIITITGWQSPEQVKQYLESSHVFILPSKAEGFPNVLLEAMAMGLPAICTDVGAISDSLKDNVSGYLLRSFDSNAIVIAMTRYLNDSSLAEQHSIEALSIISSLHNRDSNCRKLFSLF